MPEQPIHIVEMLHDRSLEEQVEYLTNEVAKLQKTLRYLLGGNLDFENIRAKGIIAENIETDKLSAISADLGEINAGKITGIEIYGTEIEGGKITGALIQTSQGGMFPRIELSTGDAILSAESSPDNKFEIHSNVSGAPTLVFTSDGDSSLIFSLPDMLSILAGSKELRLSSNKDVRISGNMVYVPSWSQVFGNGNGQTLQAALNAKANNFFGINMTLRLMWSDGSPIDLTFTNGILTNVSAV